MTVKADIQSLSPTALLEFFILDATNLPGGEVLRFHAGTNGLQQAVVWQGQTYQPMPIQASGFDVTGKGAMPRPKLQVANINGLLSASVRQFGDFVGCKLTRKRTFAKYIDAANFPARRNLAGYTDYTTPAWQNIFPTNATITTGIADPFGGNSAVRFKVGTGVTGTQASGNALLRLANQSITMTAGQTYFFSFYCRAIALPASSVTMDAADGTPSASYLSQLVLDEWVRVSAFVTATANRTVAFLDLFSDNNQACILDFAAVQFEKDALTDYQSVPGATYVGNPTADPNQYLPDDLWYVERKMSENRYMIEFELSSAFDLMGQQLPNRQVLQNSCPWVYRGTECGYTGVAYYTADNQPATMLTDVCGKTLAACKKRFGYQPIRFGGFPGAVRGNT